MSYIVACVFPLLMVHLRNVDCIHLSFNNLYFTDLFAKSLSWCWRAPACPFRCPCRPSLACVLGGIPVWTLEMILCSKAPPLGLAGSSVKVGYVSSQLPSCKVAEHCATQWLCPLAEGPGSYQWPSPHSPLELKVVDTILSLVAAPVVSLRGCIFLHGFPTPCSHFWLPGGSVV